MEETKEQIRIGVLGGTFNPVHMGHMLLAQDAIEQFQLTKVLFVPAYMPPHKTRGGLVAARHRLGMLRLAVREDARLGVATLELDRGGVSYSIDTVKALAEEHATARLFFIMGADTLPDLKNWKDIYDLLSLCSVVTMERPGFDKQSIASMDLQLDKPWSETLMKNLFSGHMIEISSSEIRQRISSGKSIRYLVPPSVERYIYRHALYL